MGSDRAKTTSESGQQYRRVVMQQGRPFLEADWNEQQELWDGDARRALLDVVGPSGTPDNGYAVGFPDPQRDYEFTVGPGTMYVGGARLSLEEPLHYHRQSEWLRAPAPGAAPARELITLEVQEHEVSAVEDEVLREVALGGPDTAQRIRLVQRIARAATEGRRCDEACQEAEAARRERGQEVDDSTGQVQSQSALKITFTAADEGADEVGADQSAWDGYLGSDNQLIRVQVSGSRRLLWGYDNASFLYGVDVGQDRATLTLRAQPVDEFHQPRPGQAVEVLRSAARLRSGAHLAAPTGRVAVVAAPYDPGAQAVVLTESLPADFHPDTDQAPLYLRVWEEELEFAPNEPVPLGDTGLQVTLRGSVFQTGDFWMVAVRAATPQTVFPPRYLAAFQPPDGPRRWSIPLAVIGWSRAKEGQGKEGPIKEGQVLDDCRRRFASLGAVTRRNAGGCCTVTVWPEDITAKNSLQGILDNYTNQEKITVCLMPGIYALPKPLTLGPGHSNLTLEGCHDGAVLQAADGAEAEFIDGLIVLCNADNVTLGNLRLEMPQVPFVDSGGKLAKVDPETMYAGGGPQIKDLRVSVGIRPWQCANLTIRDCLFRYSVSAAQDVFAAGVFAGGACAGLTLRGNRFLREVGSLGSSPLRMLIGFLLAPSVTIKSARGASFAGGSAPAGTLARAKLQEAVFQDNIFAGLTIAVLILAEFGTTRLTGNTVRESHAGFWLLSAHALAFIKAFDAVSQSEGETAQRMIQTMRVMDADPIIQVGSVLARAYPPPFDCDVTVEDVEAAPARAAGAVVSGAAARVAEAVVTQAKHVEPFLARFAGALLHHEPPLAAALEAAAPDAEAAVRSVTAPASALSSAPVPAPDPASGPSLWSGYDAVGQRISAMTAGATAASGKALSRLSLHCSGNEIDTVLDKAESGLALFVWEDSGGLGGAQKSSEVLVSANKVRGQSAHLPTALLLLVDRCAVTGNFFLNEASAGRESPAGSLDVFPGPAEFNAPPVAVTGNVLQGRANLPNRPDAALPAWDALNTLL